MDSRRGIDTISFHNTTGSLTNYFSSGEGSCLGGQKDGRELMDVAFTPLTPLLCKPIEVLQCIGFEDQETFLIKVTDTNTIALSSSAENFVYGDDVEISVGESFLLFDGGSRYVRILYLDEETMEVGEEASFLVSACNVSHPISHTPIVLSADAISGKETRRSLAICLSEDDTVRISSAKVWINPSCTASSCAITLGSSGEGFLSSSAWVGTLPKTGFAKIIQSNGTVREVVYFHNVVGSVLEVSAGGRGQYGTTPSAGSVTDSIQIIPPIMIGLEKSSNGIVQTIANESTDPVGISWSYPTNLASALAISNISSGEWYSLWSKRVVAISSIPHAYISVEICVWFQTTEGETFTRTLSASFSIKRDDLTKYVLYKSQDEDPVDFSSGTDITLPYSAASDFPCNCALHYVNEFGIEGQNREVFRVLSAPGQAVVLEDVQDLALTNIGGGQMALTGIYYDFAKASRGNVFDVQVTTDGTEPVQSTPVTAVVPYTRDLMFMSSRRKLYYLITPLLKGTVVKVAVRVRNTSTGDMSPDNAWQTVEGVSDSSYYSNGLPFAKPTIQGGIFVENDIRAITIDDIVISESPLVVIKQGPGWSDLYIDGLRIWRIRKNSNDPDRDGVYTEYGILQETSIAGTQTNLFAYQGSSDIVGVKVSDGLAMLVDMATQYITILGMQDSLENVEYTSDEAYGVLSVYTGDVLFQVLDGGTFLYTTGVALLHNEGGLATQVPWKQVTEAEFAD